MTAQQIADELLREWQQCPLPPQERLEEIDYENDLLRVRMSVNYTSDASRGTYD
ncbi:hypothetical protein [Tardiphaga sp. 709]|uniref:hypothetical protein n=1 Tax=Tardiphaga sp. 709 TaxID=3076039 RepID=UPI0028EF5ABC|nr:hypothetical protein [Tardiphaga sp. 709]WNV09991.1 hypothetical protein RSO67_01980 [Tardiphaga sp. 709]